MAFAYICRACEHPMSRHLMSDGGDLREGPYLCEHCDCSTRQGAPCYTLNQREFEARYDKQGRLRYPPGQPTQDGTP